MPCIQTVAGNLGRGLVLDVSKYPVSLAAAAVVLSSHLCVHQNSKYMLRSSCLTLDVHRSGCSMKKRSQKRFV